MLERFAQGSPLTVMAQLGLERALDAQWIDELFEKESQAQYTRELLFSTVVQVTSLVSMGLNNESDISSVAFSHIASRSQCISITSPHAFRAECRQP